MINCRNKLADFETTWGVHVCLLGMPVALLLINVQNLEV